MIALALLTPFMVATAATPESSDLLNVCIAAAQEQARKCARPCRRKRSAFRRDVCEAPCKLAHARAVLACFRVDGE